jgi:hypothetical protein
MAAVHVRAAAITLLLCLPATAAADAPATIPAARKWWAIGGRLGWNHSTEFVYGEYYDDGLVGWVNGVNVAVAALLQAPELLAVQFEPSYSQKGARGSDWTTRSSYFEVPVLARIAPSWPVRPFGIAGFGLAFLLTSETCTDSGCRELYPKGQQSGAIIGGGVEATLPYGWAFAEVRWWHGLSQVFGTGEGETDSKHRVLTLSIGYFY